tara:strand:- start:57 stop:617 length:561 start_codon:yes stop_codon:yes gene_type:complete
MADQTFTSGQILTAAQMTTLQSDIGLAYITSATATSGTSLSVNNCFTSSFSAYRIVISRATLGGVTGLSMRMRASGTDTTTGYYSIRNGFDYTTVVATTVGLSNGGNWDLPLIADTTNASCVIDVYNPQAAFKTMISGQGADARTTGLGSLTSGGMLDNTTSYDGFTVFSAQTITNITLAVFGYRK